MHRYREVVGLTASGDPVYRYASSISHDGEIAWYVVFISMVHLLELAKQKLIPEGHACRLARALLEALESPGRLVRPGFEDVFESLESFLSERTSGSSGFLWLGRSRNDHVSAVLRLYAVDRVLATCRHLVRARRGLLRLAEKYRDALVPLHTHQQPSQLASISCLFYAWEEALASSTEALLSSLGLAWRSPLGAGAGAGTVAPLDPGGLAAAAGFNGGVVASTVYASGSRLDVSMAALAAAAFLVEASRVASDIIWYSTMYTSVLVLPEDHVATSSIMPHKRNPVTLEALRGRGSRAAGLAAALLAVQAGLPYSYNLDLQEANQLLYTLLRDAEEAAWLLADLAGKLGVSREAAEKLAGGLWEAVSAELAEELAIRRVIPLREAYRIVAQAASRGELSRLAGELGLKAPGEVAGLRRIDCSKPLIDPYKRLESHSKTVEGALAVIRSARERVVREAERLSSAC